MTAGVLLGCVLRTGVRQRRVGGRGDHRGSADHEELRAVLQPPGGSEGDGERQAHPGEGEGKRFLVVHKEYRSGAFLVGNQGLLPNLDQSRSTRAYGRFRATGWTVIRSGVPDPLSARRRRPDLPSDRGVPFLRDWS